MVTSLVMSESNRIGQMEKLNCDAVAKEASVDTKVRFGALILFTVALIESRALVLQHHRSLDTDASRKTDVLYSFSLNSWVGLTQLLTINSLHPLQLGK